MSAVVALFAGLLFAYVLLIAALLVAMPGQTTVTGVLRLMPDVIRLVRRLAADPVLPRGVRVRLWMLLAYLAMPFDLVPDFVPVVGYADDAIVVSLVLRSVVRRAGRDAVERRWPGTAEGLRAIRTLTRTRASGAG
jgi:uncharacterized membrane protein YkvA (DUF1232 family)